MRTGFRSRESWLAVLLLTAFATPACAGPPPRPDTLSFAIARGHKLLRLAPPPAAFIPAPAPALPPAPAPAPVVAPAPAPVLAPARVVGAAPAPRIGPPEAQIAIIIDDLGEQQFGGLHALALPGPVALAFLPKALFTAAQATRAHQIGKEVLLHLPLQPGGGAKAYPTALKSDTGQDQLKEYVRSSLASVPYVSGVNNHQGSLMTELARPMDWLMEELARQPGLYFVDSRTSTTSLAYRAARAHGVPSAERNVFLDNARGEDAVRASFRELIAKAHRNERALAIGHPYPETFKVLNEELPQLARRYGVELIAPSELIARQSGTRGPYRQLQLTPALALGGGTAASH